MEEMDYIVTLTDENGNDERFEFIDLLEKDGQKYAVLMPADDEESTDVVIMQMREEEERLLSVDELFEAAGSGALEEAWCVGTAAVISPIGELYYKDRSYVVNDGQIGALSQKLYDELTGIQWGQKDDPFGWTCRV